MLPLDLCYMPVIRKILFSLIIIFSLGIKAQDTSYILPEKKATYYHNKFENRRTASGERFSQRKYTAAHKYIALGSIVKVTNRINNKTVLVKINDRCPRKGVIDLSYIAAKRLGIIESGHANVTVEVLPDYFYSLWLCQDSLFASIDKYSSRDSLQKVYQDSLIFSQKNKLDNQLLWTYYLQIDSVETLEEVRETFSSLPEKYKIYVKAILVKGRRTTYYKVVIGPFMNEEWVQKIKEELNPQYEKLIIEKNMPSNKM